MTLLPYLKIVKMKRFVVLLFMLPWKCNNDMSNIYLVRKLLGNINIDCEGEEFVMRI